MRTALLVGISLLALSAAGMGTAALAADTPVQMAQAAAAAKPAGNPLLTEWKTPYGVPPFASFKTEHFLPAYNFAMAENLAEIDAIAKAGDAPTFANTIEALERTGRTLARVNNVFNNLGSSLSSDALQAVELELAPKLAGHYSTIAQNAALFKRIDAVFARRSGLGLSPEQVRLVERYHLNFVRAGAQLTPDAQKRVAEISARMATATTVFSQNVQKDENSFQLLLESPEDMAGLPQALRDNAAESAKERGLAGKQVITLARSSVEPFLTYSARRDLREKAFRAWAARGQSGGATDNAALIREILTLRTERAKLLGYDSFAAFKLADTMAKTPAAAMDLMLKMWEPAKAAMARDRVELQALAKADGLTGPLEAWDWRYYAEKVRQAKYSLDEAEVKPYLQLDNVAQAAFDTAGRLFGISFTPRPDIASYHPDVRVYEVKDAAGKHVGIYMQDNFARPYKRSGAWMSSFRDYQAIDGTPVTPIILNNNNGAKANPSLMSFDDANTLFHEFGHALHGLLTTAKYPSQAGTNTLTDFVEFPSQVYEHWLMEPQVLRKYAKHYQTGEPMPESLLKRIKDARNFNQGWQTVEFLASALVDMELHMQTDVAKLDAATFEAVTLKKLGMPSDIIMRHRLPHFLHLFSSDGYAAGYYSYLWAQVLEADGFAAFEEKGDAFDPGLAAGLKALMEGGDTKDPMDLYVAFRGRKPTIDALLIDRSFAPAKPN
jgi:peptidyl-dipeptidase Dcp